MTELNVGQTGERVYLPFPIAEDRGLVGDPQRLNIPPGVLFSSGLLPGSSNGGAVEVGGQIWGIDHVAIQASQSGREFTLTGTDKSLIQVNEPDKNIGIVRGEGAITLTHTESGRVVLGALIQKYDAWNSDRLNKLGMSAHRVGAFFVGIPNLTSRMPRHLTILKTTDHEVITRV